MMRFCWRRGAVILFVFSFSVAVFFIFRSGGIGWFVRSGVLSSPQAETLKDLKDDVTSIEHLILERLAVSFPEFLKNASKMSVQQKKQLIELIRRDAIASAFANGHSEVAAREYGEAVAMAVSKAIFNSSIGDDYF
ncbi:hypothetical protein [Bartonella sp. CB175]|uniref:hypothetical protein n=1 Tax=Bartonella sp. CB175 TaxID=3112256 RepID=UPI00300E6894